MIPRLFVIMVHVLLLPVIMTLSGNSGFAESKEQT